MLSLKDDQCANYIILLPPHIACGLRELFKLNTDIELYLSTYSKMILFHLGFKF